MTPNRRPLFEGVSGKKFNCGERCEAAEPKHKAMEGVCVNEPMLGTLVDISFYDCLREKSNCKCGDSRLFRSHVLLL